MEVKRGGAMNKKAKAKLRGARWERQGQQKGSKDKLFLQKNLCGWISFF
jgi:hypothetical protein